MSISTPPHTSADRRPQTLLAVLLSVASLAFGLTGATADLAAADTAAHPTAEGAPPMPDNPTPLGELARGDAHFWEIHIDASGVVSRADDAAVCGPVQAMNSCAYGVELGGGLQEVATTISTGGPYVRNVPPECSGTADCRAWSFEVTEPGELLRVSAEATSNQERMPMYVYGPDGVYRTKVAFGWSREAFLADPDVGSWTLLLVASDVRDSAVRMRVALDPQVEKAPKVKKRHQHDYRGRRGELLPNLVVIPPHELGFGECQFTETTNAILDERPVPTRCLRFATGPGNTGEGPLDLFITEDGEVEGAMEQRIHREDGSQIVREAGRFDYHLEHAHYHASFLNTLELFAVNGNRLGPLVGEGPKQGHCTGPYMLMDWTSFRNDPPGAAAQDNSCSANMAPVNAQISLDVGWGDIYGWYVEGQYVDFGDNPDGEYVVRAWTDKDGGIAETDDTDNVSYAHIRVTGETVEVLERGFGHSPFDRRKRIADDIRRPVRWDGGALD